MILLMFLLFINCNISLYDVNAQNIFAVSDVPIVNNMCRTFGLCLYFKYKYTGCNKRSSHTNIHIINYKKKIYLYNKKESTN